MPIISHAISSPAEAAGSISCTGVNIFPSPKAGLLLFGNVSLLKFQLLEVSLGSTSKRIKPFDPTWNWVSILSKKQKSKGKSSTSSHASSIFVFTELVKPSNGKGGTNAISVTV